MAEIIGMAESKTSYQNMGPGSRITTGITDDDLQWASILLGMENRPLPKPGHQVIVVVDD